MCGLVEADAHHAVFEIAQVHAVFEGDFLQVADGNSFGKFDFQRIKEIRIDLSVPQLLDFAGEETSVGVDTSCYVAQSFGTVVNRIESGHSCQQRLGGTNIRSSLLAFDMLFAGLQCQAVRLVSVSILGDTDDAARNLALVIVACRKISGRRSAVEHRDTEALARAEDNIRAPFARRSQQDEAHQVGCDSYLGTLVVATVYEIRIVLDRAVRVRILDDGSIDILSQFSRLVISELQFDTLRDSTRMDNCRRRFEYVVVDEERIRSSLDLSTAAGVEQHRSSFGGSRSLVQQRTVGERHGGQVANHRLEIQQSFQAALGNFSLIRRIGGVPNRIFKYVPHDGGGADRIVPAHSDIGSIDFVLGGQFFYMFGKFPLRHWLRQVQRLLEADILRNRLVDELVQRTDSNRTQHGCDVVRIDTEVSANKFICVHDKKVYY